MRKSRAAGLESLNSSYNLATELGAMVATAFLVVGTTVGYASIIFTGPLSDGLPRAATAFILGSGIAQIILGLRSRFVPVFGSTQDGPAVVIAAMAAAAISSKPDTSIASVTVLVAVTALASGLAMLLVAKANLGRVIRYLPSTVVSAFIAGTGWLLFMGGFTVMVGKPVGLSDLAYLSKPEVAKFWIPGFVIGVLSLIFDRSKRIKPVAGSVLAVFALVSFYLVGLSVSSISALGSEGWLIGPFPGESRIQPISASELNRESVELVFSQLPGIFSVAALSVVALLLNLGGMEALTGLRAEVDDEATTVGLTNLVVAPLGGLVCFHSLSNTTLARQVGGSTRAVPVGSGVFVIGFALVGARFIEFLPRAVVGALLVTVGLSLLARWVSELVATVDWTRRIFSLVIVATIASVGILEGIGAGVVLATALFVIQYSRVDPVRLESMGSEVRSHVDRTPEDEAVLDSLGGRVAVFELQGFLFFGSLVQFAERVRGLLSGSDGELGSVVMDFNQVTGIDQTGFSLLAEIRNEIEAVGSGVIVSGLSEKVRLSFGRSEPQFFEGLVESATMDEALEVAEDRLLSPLSGHESAESCVPGGLGFSASLVSEFDRRSVEAGTIVTHQDSPSDSLYVVVSGELSAYRVDPDGSRQRLRRFGRGAMIGEIGIITGAVRSADVYADTDVELLFISADRYQQLRVDSPELLIELQDRIMVDQSHRVVSLSARLARALR